MIRRLTVLTAAVGAALVALAGPAAAHVTVQAPGATQGGFTKLTFRVPTERPVATTKLVIQFPDDAPLAFANIKPHAGWTYTVEKGAPAQPFQAFGEDVKEVIKTITWTSTGPGIAQGEFDEFEVSGGPLPALDTMVFKALQTYANGETVRWIDVAAPGSTEELEHPAPLLELAASEGKPEATPSGTAEPSLAPVAATGSSDDGGSNGLSLAALIAALAALAASAYAAVRSRARTAVPAQVTST